jgi:hypothetical protein
LGQLTLSSKACAAGSAASVETTVVNSSTLLPTTFTSTRSPASRLRQPRHRVTLDRFKSGVGQSNRVDHAAGEFADAQRWGAVARQHTHGFRGQPPDRREIDDIVDLLTETGGAGGEHDRIAKREAGDLHRKWSSRVGICGRGGHRDTRAERGIVEERR